MNKVLNGQSLRTPPSSIEKRLAELGKLYLFPVERPELKAQGLEKQWFLTHQKGDCLFCGHINNQGEWSLCKDKDLTPTFDYHAVEEVWALLANDDFVAGFKSETELDYNRSINVFNEDESGSDEELIKLDQSEKKTTLINMGQIPFASNSQDIYVEVEGEEKERKQELAELREEEHQVTEQERQLLEQDLHILLWEGYQADLLDLDNQDANQPWLIELEEETDLIQLISTKDQHTVISLDQDGVIVDHLSLADAELLVDGFVLQEKEQEQEDKSREKRENIPLNSHLPTPPIIQNDSPMEKQKTKGLELE